MSGEQSVPDRSSVHGGSGPDGQRTATAGSFLGGSASTERDCVSRGSLYRQHGGWGLSPDHARRGWSAVSSYQGHRSGLSGPDRYGGVFGPCTAITTQ